MKLMTMTMMRTMMIINKKMKEKLIRAHRTNDLKTLSKCIASMAQVGAGWQVKASEALKPDMMMSPSQVSNWYTISRLTDEEFDYLYPMGLGWGSYYAFALLSKKSRSNAIELDIEFKKRTDILDYEKEFCLPKRPCSFGEIMEGLDAEDRIKMMRSFRGVLHPDKHKGKAGYSNLWEIFRESSLGN